MSEPTTTEVPTATDPAAASEPAPPATFDSRPMHRGRWAIRIIALGLGLIVVLAGTASVVGLFFVRTTVGTMNFTEPVHRVEANTGTGTLTVRAGAPGESTHVVSKARSAFRHAIPQVNLLNGVLYAEGNCDGSFIIADSCSVDFDIVVPPGTSVLARASTGDLNIIAPGSSVVATTDTGDIKVLGGAGRGTLKLNTDTGEISAQMLNSAKVSARTDTGDIRLSFNIAPDRVDANAATGDVTMILPDDQTVYKVDLNTSTGDESVGVPTSVDASRVINAQTATGNVHLLTRD